MPFIGQMYQYWIDESSLTPLSAVDRALFIANVDAAAATWNSTRIHDDSGEIVNLQRVSSNGVFVVPVRYYATLPDNDRGYYNPIPLFHEIKLRVFTDRTPLHEFGHMLGLQDLDLNNDSFIHNVLMGYSGPPRSGMQYQDIQGLAVVNEKHTNHDFSRYYQDGSWYKYICFYYDITDSVLTNAFMGGTHLENAATCRHTYKRLVSAGDRHWQKCTKCYKVVESEFTINVLEGNLIEITGLLDSRTAVFLSIPRICQRVHIP